MNKRTVSGTIFNICNIAFMILLSCVMLYPMLHVLFASLSDSTQVMQHNGLLLKPLGFTVDAYKAVFRDERVFSGYTNTVIVLLGGVAINIVLTCIAAYFLTRKNACRQIQYMRTIFQVMERSARS